MQVYRIAQGRTDLQARRAEYDGVDADLERLNFFDKMQALVIADQVEGQALEGKRFDCLQGIVWVRVNHFSTSFQGGKKRPLR